MIEFATVRSAFQGIRAVVAIAPDCNGSFSAQEVRESAANTNGPFLTASESAGQKGLCHSEGVLRLGSW